MTRNFVVIKVVAKSEITKTCACVCKTINKSQLFLDFKNSGVVIKVCVIKLYAIKRVRKKRTPGSQITEIRNNKLQK